MCIPSFIVVTALVYMLGTDLKPAARFKAIQTYLKLSGRFRSRPDGLRAVQTASKPSV